MKLIGGLFKTAFWLVWILLVLVTPLLGAWLSSSLVSYFGGPREAALVGCALLFPVLPLVWEARATRQFKGKVASRNWFGKPPKRWLSTPWRIVLRTLALNLAFIGALLFWHPKVAFSALATRGDWFLDGRHDEVSERLRGDLFVAASGLEWLHKWANPNPYKKDGDTTPVPDDVKPTEQTGPITPPPPPPPLQPDAGILQPDAGAAPGGADAGAETAEPTPAPDIAKTDEGAPKEETWKVGATTWPRANEISKTVAAMRPEDEGTLEAVARYIAAREADPFERVKALHDWVVTRLRYDQDTFKAITASGGRGGDAAIKPQDAESVFKARAGVCEGYARLLVALGQVTGDRFAFVVGDVRHENGEVSSLGHAWNAVQINGAWYIVDATWDDPVSKDGKDIYQTDYLFIPPSVATLDHFPEEERWQLRAKPLTRGEFLRQPFASPGLARESLAMLSPDRSSVEVDDRVELRLANPRHLHVMATLYPEGSSEGIECGVDNQPEVHLRCKVPSPGRYQARLFTNTSRYGRYGSVAMVQVTRR